MFPLQKPLADRSEERDRLLHDLLDISRHQREVLKDSNDEQALERYLHWSQKFTEKSQEIDKLNTDTLETNLHTVRSLIEEIRDIQQQIEQEMNTRFSNLISEIKATRQAKTAVTGYYGGHPPVSLYFDEKQ